MTHRLATSSTSHTGTGIFCDRSWLPSCWRLFVIVAVGVLVSIILVSRGQADEDDDEPPAVAAINAQQIRITDQSFDEMVFGVRQVVLMANGAQKVQVAGHRTPAAFRERMEATIGEEIQALDRRLSLSNFQKKKLQLAAPGDIAQYISRAAELRPKLTLKPLTQAQYAELMQELQPLRLAQQFGIFGDSSLFRKTLRGILTEEQRVRFRTLEREQQGAIIETGLKNMERLANGLRLAGETRRKFVEMILDHGHMPLFVGPYAQYVVMLEASLLRDRIRPLLTDDEWLAFEAQVALAKRVEPTLERYGIWTARRFKD